MIKIRKAIITAAGWGTRFLPVTRSQPKEMLPLVNKPLIHYAVQEAIDSGIEQIILVTAMGKHAIEDYFDRSFELEHVLEKKGDNKLLEEMRRISALADICYIRQKEQLGLGHAVSIARSIVADEPFALILPDDIIDGRVPALKQLMDVYRERGTSVVAVERIDAQDTMKYGIISPEEMAPRLHRVLDLIEKPEPEDAPSDLGIVGRYILVPEIFDALACTGPGSIKEIQLTDAIRLLLKEHTVTACEFEGARYDTGNPSGWLEANVAMALTDPDIGPGLKQRIRKLL
ncbi:MAG: UTP--glucose-1-phosphate uridylyltransferase GalU [Dehalococcoidales bacterium]